MVRLMAHQAYSYPKPIRIEKKREAGHAGHLLLLSGSLRAQIKAQNSTKWKRN